MKKVLLTAALTSLALASCSNDEVVTKTTQDPDEIKIEATTSTLSRAYTPETHPDFQLFANKTVSYSSDIAEAKREVGAELLKNITLTYENSKWKFKDGSARYWPDGNYDFFAIATEETAQLSSTDYSGCSVKVDCKEAVTPTYKNVLNAGTITVSNDFNKQGDIIYAATQNQSKTTKSGTVPLNFRHALAQVLFEFQNVSKSLYVEIKSIALTNVYNKGTLMFGYDDTQTNFAGLESSATDAKTTSTEYNEAGFDDDCTWTIDETGDKVSIDYSDAVKKGHQAFALSPDVDKINNIKTTLAIGYDEIGHENPIYVMPQIYGTDKNDGYDTWVNVYNTKDKSGTCLVIRCHVYNIANTADLKTAIDSDIASATEDQIKSLPSIATTLADKRAATGSALDKYLGTQLTMYGSTGDNYYQDLYIPLPLYTSDGAETEAQHDTILGWEAGKRYTYKIIFGGSGDANPGSKDPDGNDVFTQIAVTTSIDGMAANVHKEGENDVTEKGNGNGNPIDI